MRHVLTFAVAAAAIIGCGSPPDPKHPSGPGSIGSGSAGGGGTAKRGGGGGGGDPAAGGASDPKPKDIACLVPSCV